ncbi:MAG: hypothetical protein RLY16_1885 [Bacteroidota bacterium]|jgi:dihydroorotate dehydrogenase
MYQFIRRFLFHFDAEKVHLFAMNSLSFLRQIPGLGYLIEGYCKPSKSLPVKAFGLNFPNWVGLAAGFDKNAHYLAELKMLGFGFVEIGTVTPRAQAGNEKPRLFRLPADQALINRMGFNNEGVEAVVERLQAWRKKYPIESAQNTMIIGGNIGKNKVTPNEDAWQDYEICFRALRPYVDYFVVNVSSPNTPGLRALQEKDALKQILTNLQQLNKKISGTARPILLKIAPDLNQHELDDVIDLALEIQLDGLVATNTTISREGLTTPEEKVTAIGAGGLSGKPVQKRSTEVLRYIIEKTNGRIPVMASGGIFTKADAQEKLEAGASLVQVYTGFIYVGPTIVKQILNK